MDTALYWVIPIGLALFILAVWLLLRDDTDSQSTGRHRDPHDQPLVQDEDDPPPDPGTEWKDWR